MKASEFVPTIGPDRVPGVTVFHGSEPWFIAEGIRAIRAAFLGEDDEGFLSVDAPRGPGDREGVALPELIDDLRTFPMFGGRKVVVWRTRSLDGETAKPLGPLAKSPPSFARLVVVAASLGKGVGPALGKAGATVADSRRLFDTPWPGKPEWDTQLDRWAADRARTRGLKMSLRMAHLLTGIVGNDLGAVDGALEKLAIGGGGEVTEEAVRALTGGGRDFDAFAFGEAIYARDQAKAFRIARNAFREGMEDGRGGRIRDLGTVVGRLLWSVRFRLGDVYRAARELEGGASPAEAARTVQRGGNQAAARRAVDQARRFTPAELLEHYVLLVDAETETRRGLPGDTVLEALVPKLTGEADG
jgi:DNA polymerase III delta subunit